MPWRRADLPDGHEGENEHDGESEAHEHLPETGMRTSDSTHSYPKVAVTAGTGVHQRWTRAFREI